MLSTALQVNLYAIKLKICFLSHSLVLSTIFSLSNSTVPLVSVECRCGVVTTAKAAHVMGDSDQVIHCLVMILIRED